MTEANNPGTLGWFTAAVLLPAIRSAAPQLLSVGADKMVHFWQWRPGKLLKSWPGLDAPVREMVVAPDGKSVVAASRNYDGDQTRDTEVRI